MAVRLQWIPLRNVWRAAVAHRSLRAPEGSLPETPSTVHSQNGPHRIVSRYIVTHNLTLVAKVRRTHTRWAQPQHRTLGLPLASAEQSRRPPPYVAWVRICG